MCFLYQYRYRRKSAVVVASPILNKALPRWNYLGLDNPRPRMEHSSSHCLRDSIMLKKTDWAWEMFIMAEASGYCPWLAHYTLHQTTHWHRTCITIIARCPKKMVRTHILVNTLHTTCTALRIQNCLQEIRWAVKKKWPSFPLYTDGLIGIFVMLYCIPHNNEVVSLIYLKLLLRLFWEGSPLNSTYPWTLSSWTSISTFQAPRHPFQRLAAYAPHRLGKRYQMICFRCFFTCAHDWKNVFREIYSVSWLHIYCKDVYT